MLECIFHLAENQTSVRRELMAGLTTFMTIAYVVVVNPRILSEAGMPVEGVLIGLASLAKRYAKLRNLSEIEWIVHGCLAPNRISSYAAFCSTEDSPLSSLLAWAQLTISSIVSDIFQSAKRIAG